MWFVCFVVKTTSGLATIVAWRGLATIVGIGGVGRGRPLTYDAGYRWDTPGLVWDGMVPDPNPVMPNDNQVSATLTDANITDILTHLAALETLLPFLISRAEGDNNVMLGEKSVGFDEKCAAYMTSHPQFIHGHVSAAEVLKDRALRAQFQKFLPRLNLLAAKAQDTYDMVGNKLMMADLAYYGSTGDAAKHGTTTADDIHGDLATRYPGRPAKSATPKP